MYNTWHIPRASISGGSSKSSQCGGGGGGGSVVRNSDSPYKKCYRKKLNYPHQPTLTPSLDYYDKDNSRNLQNIDIKVHTSINGNNKKIDVSNKRRSQSSYGSSSDSNHSSQSASSGSLLLTVANLEQFANAHHKKQLAYQCNKYLQQQQQQYQTNISIYSENIEQNKNMKITDHYEQQQQQQQLPSDATITRTTISQINNNTNKAKDFDTLSIASSTHFTVINGIGGPQRITKDGICSRGHQITILILTMSFFFLIGIVGAVFFLEIRAHKMPH